MDLPDDDPLPPGPRAPAPAALHSDQFTLPAEPASVGLARRRVREALQQWGISALNTDDVALALSEIVTNALLHGTRDLHEAIPPQASQSDPISVSLEHLDDSLKLTVTDPSDLPPEPQESGPASIGGRGLALLSHLAKDWGWTPREEGGKAVWSLFVLA